MTTHDSNLTVAAVQMVTGLSLQKNLTDAARLIAEAASKGAQLVALPEYFCLMGQGDEAKLSIQEDFVEEPLVNVHVIQHFLAGQAKQHGVWLVSGTMPLRSPESHRVYNTTLVYTPTGKCTARYDKVHLFKFQTDSENFDEGRTICPGSQPLIFDAPIGKVGVGVCYDLRFPEFFRQMNPVNLMILPAAFTATTGVAHWEVLLRARAIENQCYVLASAQGGTHENGRKTFGHSMLIDPWGKVIDVLAQGEGVVMGEVDLTYLAQVRTQLPALQHRVF